MKKTLFLLLALPGMVQAEQAETKDYSYFASSTSGSGDITYTVDAGQSGNKWSAAFGTSSGDDDNSLTHTGNITMTYADTYAGTGTASGNGTTAFGVVNVGEVTGNVNLVFDAANATYGTFTTQAGKAASVVGGYKGSIGGTFTATINAGTFNNDIMGGLNTADNGDSIGATAIEINGGTVKGNIYGGGVVGTINGDTAVTITNLTALGTHDANSSISAGGKGTASGRTIKGNGTVTFSNVEGSYAGTVSGGAEVQGSSSLVVNGNSTLTLNNVTDFDTLTVEEGSSLTVNGNFNTTAQLSVTYDAATAASKTESGFGAGVLSVNGGGSLSFGENSTIAATINGSAVTNRSGKELTDSSIYYLMDGWANIGNHGMTQPAERNDLDAAYGWYVADGATMYVHDATDVYSTGDAITHIYGEGDIVLRSANDVPVTNKYLATINGKTNTTGKLIINPTGSHEGYAYSRAVELHLGSATQSADISSFESITISGDNIHTDFFVDGELNAADGRGHFNNVAVEASLFQVNFISGTYHFAGATTFETTEFNNRNKMASITFARNCTDADIVIHMDELSDANDLPDTYIGNWNTHFFAIGGDVNYNADSNSTFTLNIDSINTKAYISLNNTHSNIIANFNIEAGNKFWQKQYDDSTSSTPAGTASLTLTGEGTYVLTEGKSIRDNFGIVSTEIDAETGRHKWRGTVEVTNLTANDAYTSGTTKNGIDLSLYGNSESYAHFTGFKGYFFDDLDGYTNMASDVNLILSNSDSNATNSDSNDTPYAFEICNGFSNQKIRFNGDIMGDGSMVVSKGLSQTITFAGDVSEWTNGGEYVATNGTSSVVFTGEATEINPNVKANGGNLNATISNTEAVTVGGTFSHAAGSQLNLTVDTAKGTTFNAEFDVTNLTVNAGATATVTQTGHAGNVLISDRNGSSATLSDGMSISSGSIRGGKAENATLAFDSDNNNTVSGTTLDNVALTSVSGSRVTIADISATDVYLMGQNVDFYAMVESTQFKVTEVATEGVSSYNEVRFETDVLSGMTLADDGASVTLAVNNDVDWGDFSVNDVKSNVTILLRGFTLEGVASSGKGWPSDYLVFDSGMNLIGTGAVGVSDLLDIEAQQYQYVAYQQTSEGLVIRMQHSIPEPTTATLSLLALAALAARRRRSSR